MRALVIGTFASAVAVVFGAQGFDDTPGLPGEAPSLAAGQAGVAAALPGRVSTAAPDELDDALTAMIRRNCVTCHNDGLMTGNLSLQRFHVADAAGEAETAEKMIVKLRANMMPPPGMPRPAGDSLLMLVDRLEQRVDEAAAAYRRAGTRRFQRLNQDEYARSIRMLLDLEVDAGKWLPSDNYISSFDTHSDAQGLSTALLEAYLRAAADISRLAVGNPTAAKLDIAYPVPIEISQHAWDYVEGAPYGTRGGIVATHDFPTDGEYIFSVETVLAQRGKHFQDLDISIDGVQVALLALPLGQSGVRATAGNAGGDVMSTEPIFVPAGQHRVSAAFVRKIEGPYEDRFVTHLWSMVGGEDSSAGRTMGSRRCLT